SHLDAVDVGAEARLLVADDAGAVLDRDLGVDARDVGARQAQVGLAPAADGEQRLVDVDDPPAERVGHHETGRGSVGHEERDYSRHPVIDPPRRTLRLEAPRSWQTLNLAELWAYRELLFFFVWRDVKVRYKQTVLGALWAIIQPLATTFAFALLFGRLGGMARQVDGPYALHVFVGMLPWTFFANAVTAASNSLIGSGHLISKVYFPRIIVPVAAISFLVLLVMMAVYHVAPSWSMMAMPLFLLGTIVTAAGAGLLFAALIVTY